MDRWILRSSFLALALWLLFAAWAQRELRAAYAPPARTHVRQILVLYQERADAGRDLDAVMTANLAGRFGRPVLREMEAYRGGDLARFDALLVVPAEGGARAPDALLADVRAADRPVIWLQHGIEPLFEDAAFAAAQGWRPAERAEAGYVTVRYKERDFPRDLRAATRVAEPVVADPVRVRTFAAARRQDGGEVPWAVRSGNLVYVAEAPFAFAHEDDRYLVFADLLFEVLAPQAPERHRAMVRIEDVGPEANPRRIRALADLLAAEGVPFSIAVYDTYRDPEGRYSEGRPRQISLRQRPQLVQALEYAVSRGATLVAHGHTHQTDLRRNPYARVSGADYEFFAADLRDGAFELRGPLPNDGLASWRDRFAASRRAWRRAGLDPPDIFTTPHYAASPTAYAAAREAYRARYERALYFAGEAKRGGASAQAWETQFFPYETVDLRGDFILPENLGFASGVRQGYSGRGPEELIATAQRNLAVRDGFASFYHHWHEDPHALQTIVRGIRDLGYRFVGPAEVVRDAPAHAPRAIGRASPVAAANAGWVRRLPRLDAPVLVALIAFVSAMWLTSEAGMKRLARPRRRRRGLAAA